jgi:3-methylfumaryl-CoA hydratase
MDAALQTLEAALGRKVEREDRATPRLAQGLIATLAPLPLYAPKDVAPLGLHWCLAPPSAPGDQLQPDGHPAGDGVLPALPGLRRMWAGGEVEVLGVIDLHDRVSRVSTLESVTRRHGSTGELLFAAVRHEYRTFSGLVLRERQDLVYRLPPSEAASAAPVSEPEDTHSWPDRWTVPTSPTLLFRYSALTFNGHRIHYDEPYATQVEGYDGLVVHGPLQATVLLNLAAAVLGRAPAKFTYRGVSPLIAGTPFEARARSTSDGLRLETVGTDGRVAMRADAI